MFISVWHHVSLPVTSGMLYVAVKGYQATKGDEATVAIGAVVEVLQQSENGWWLIRYHSNDRTALWRGEMAPLISALWFTRFIVLVLH